MTADAWQVYDVFLAQVGAELHKLNAVDTIKMGLCTSDYTPNTDSDVTWATIDANEVANGNGYTTGGEDAAATWTVSSGVLTFDVANVTWTATDDGITCRYAVLYNSSAGGTNNLIAYCLLDNTPADVTADAGEDLTVAINASGVFTITQS